MYLDLLHKYNIILGSQSPRRAFLLHEAGINFSQQSKDTDESYPDTLKNEAIVKYLAEKKAEAFRPTLLPNDLVITADTIVVFEGEVLGKPGDENEARQLLRRLSGKTHTVFTGVSILSSSKSDVFSVKTAVKFKSIADDEIKYYIDNFQPYDKAGAYGIQEWFGYVCVESISGSYTNVMGLPVYELCTHLENF